MQVIGAGLGRTGTASLKLALETLLGEPCYHMFELFNRPRDVDGWQTAADRGDPDWPALLNGWGATVDWPASAFFEEQAAAFPDAKVLLSYRDSESWWASADRTIFEFSRRGAADTQPANPLTRVMRQIFDDAGVDPFDKDASIAAFERHNQAVRTVVSRDRLIEWQPGDGWGPLCDGLGLPAPEIDFPHSNSSMSFAETAMNAAQGNVERIVDPPPTSQ